MGMGLGMSIGMIMGMGMGMNICMCMGMGAGMCMDKGMGMHRVALLCTEGSPCDYGPFRRAVIVFCKDRGTVDHHDRDTG